MQLFAESYLQVFVLLFIFPKSLLGHTVFIHKFVHSILSAYPMSTQKSLPSQGAQSSRHFSWPPRYELLILLPGPQRTLLHWSSSSFSALGRTSFLVLTLRDVAKMVAPRPCFLKWKLQVHSVLNTEMNWTCGPNSYDLEKIMRFPISVFSSVKWEVWGEAGLRNGSQISCSSSWLPAWSVVLSRVLRLHLGYSGENCNWLALSATGMAVGGWQYVCHMFLSLMYGSSKNPVNSAIYNSVTQWNCFPLSLAGGLS